jgi:hypothetical protein
MIFIVKDCLIWRVINLNVVTIYSNIKKKLWKNIKHKNVKFGKYEKLHFVTRQMECTQQPNYFFFFVWFLVKISIVGLIMTKNCL